MHRVMVLVAVIRSYGSNGDINEAHDVDEYCGKSCLFFLTTTTQCKSENYGISLSGEIVRRSAELSFY